MSCPANSLTAPSTLDDRWADGWGNASNRPRARPTACSAGGSTPASTSRWARVPRDWLRPASDRLRPRPHRAVTPTSPSQASETLAELRDWLASSVQPAAGLGHGAANRCPHGPENAAVMLLSRPPGAARMPPSGQPIGGEAWRWRSKMLAAIGIGPDEAYSASLSCFHAPGARIDGRARAACAEIARDHIAWPSPQRLILFGDAPCPGPARRAAGPRPRPRSSDRRRAHRRHLPSALAAAAAVATRRWPGATCCC